MLKNKQQAKIKSVELQATDFGKYIVTFSRHNGRNKRGKSSGFICHQYGYSHLLTALDLSRIARAQQVIIERNRNGN